MAYAREKNGGYELRMTYGYTESGKRKSYSRTWNPPKGMNPRQIQKELQIQLKIFESDIKNERKINALSEFKDMAVYWMENDGKEKLAPKTYIRYKELLQRVYDSKIGHTKLIDINQMDLNDFYRSLAKPGVNKLTGGALSNKTIREHHNVISKVLEVAWKWGLIDENVAKRADPPSPRSKETSCMNEEEAINVLSLLRDEPIQYKTMISLLILFGIRRGELCGLEWKDIDFDNQTISIRRNSQYVSGEIITKDPKTQKSTRVLSMDDYSLALLNEYKTFQDEKKKKAGPLWTDTDRLFTKYDGTPIHPDTVGDWWDKFQKRNGLEHHTLHSLRHTNASLLISHDTDVATVSGRLGHSNPNTTLKVYSHMFRARDREAAQTLGNIAFAVSGG
ncbi:MAG: site-specific integrase [Clostridia bacterium]|nr:site-specific integrase [Clostridia bacterium]MBQ6467410.1 site-specific integrase [Clostridia bacterium]